MEKIEKYIRLEHLSYEEIDEKNFTEEEIRYLYLAKKMPYRKVMQYLNRFKNFRDKIDEYLFSFGMCEYFSVSHDELVERLEYIDEIKEYFEEKEKQIVKEQKKMIKKMERI